MPRNQKSTWSSGKPFGIAVDRVLQARAGDIFHDDPGVALVVVLDVVQVDQVRVLEIEALADAAQLDLQIPLDVLERELFAGVAGGEIDLAEAAAADATLDDEAVERSRAAGILELHGTASLTEAPLRWPVRPTRLSRHEKSCV